MGKGSIISDDVHQTTDLRKATYRTSSFRNIATSGASHMPGTVALPRPGGPTGRLHQGKLLCIPVFTVGSTGTLPVWYKGYLCTQFHSVVVWYQAPDTATWAMPWPCPLWCSQCYMLSLLCLLYFSWESGIQALSSDHTLTEGPDWSLVS